MKYVSEIIVALLLFISPFALHASSDKKSPEQIPGSVTIDVVKAKELFDDGVIFIDVRSDKDWNAGRVPDAEHLDVKTTFTEENIAILVGNKNEPMVLYCNGHKCLRSSTATQRAIDWGYTNVYYFRDGFPIWKSEDNPVE